VKILFFYPCRAGQGNIPVNVPLLISILKKHGHEVKLFDLTDYEVFNNKSYEKLFFKEAEYNEEALLKDRESFYKNSNLGINLKNSDYTEDFNNLVDSFKPDIIAVSLMSVDFKFTINFLRPIKQKYDTKIVIGGIHAILLPEETISNDVCDYVCIGEGESSIINLIEALEKNYDLSRVHGIWYKNNGIICKNDRIELTDLTKVPFLDFDYFDPIHFYRPFDGARYKMINYEFSRGCPFTCSYCVNGILKDKYKGLGKYHRNKGISQSIEELKYLINKYSFDFVRFWDEDFTANSIELIKNYAKVYNKHIKLPFIIYSRVESITDEKVKILKEMGCKTFAIGIESGNENIRKKVLNRHMSNKTLIEKFNIVKKHGIRTSAYNMIGLPYDTKETIFDTINLNREIGPTSFSVTMLEPYRGTPIRELCEKEGLDPNHETVYNKAQFIPKGMTKEELEGLFKTFALYIKLPISEWENIKKSEKDDELYLNLLKKAIR